MQFVVDLDGTICFQGRPVSKKLQACLASLTECGHEVFFASARPIRDMLPVLEPSFHHYPMVGGNGALCARNGQILDAVYFPVAVQARLLELLAQQSASCLLDSSWDYAYNGPSDHPILRQVDEHRLAVCRTAAELGPLIKVLVLNADSMDRLAAELDTLPLVVHRHHQEQVIDISPEGIHKWSALRKLGVVQGQFVAVGNDANDLTMFQASGHAIMIGEHPLLAPYANESVPLGDRCEDELIMKLTWLQER